MYTCCVWCARHLGRNETLEAFPVGRRLAFDQAKGRLWVVCPTCTRWNLSPIEERWDAIEACERLYRDTRKRVATDQIGLAHVGDGVELVRIGAPLLPEFAAWRYGNEFTRRMVRSTIRDVASMALDFSLGSSWLSLFSWASTRDLWLNSRVVAHVDDPRRNAPSPLTVLAAEHARFEFRNDVPVLALPTWKDVHRTTRARGDVLTDLVNGGREKRGWFDVAINPDHWLLFTGAAALEALSRAIPHINHDGAIPSRVRASVALVERERDVAALWRSLGPSSLHLRFSSKDASVRLAMEMLLHDNDERRWLEGELADLESRWREAEAIAAITDRLGRLPPVEPQGL
jgi:hypothetical protein